MTQAFQINRRRLLGGTAWLTIASGLPSRAGAQDGSSGHLPDASGPWPSRELIRLDPARSRYERLRAKPALGSTALPAMTQASRWSARAPAALATATMADGRQIPRLTTPMTDPALQQNAASLSGHRTSYIKEGFGTCYWRFRWDEPQDWSGVQRIAFFIRPIGSGLASYRPALALIGEDAPIEASDPMPIHYLPGLKPDEWNHVVWEFTELTRHKVVEFAILQPLAGPPGRTVRYEVRDFTLEQVEPDSWAGWQIAAGRIAFNHGGYAPGAAKIAHAAPGGDIFSLVHADTGKTVATLPARIAEHRIGRFATLDFSDFATEGRYMLRYGGADSQPFPISDRGTADHIDRLLNFFYADRCGCAVEGVHGVCHERLFVEHRGVRRGLNGGWHDAGNLCQGAYRTALATGALLTLCETARDLGEFSRARRLIEEACWGLDWLLKTRFGDGSRMINASYTVMEDGSRNLSDFVVPAENAVFESLMFAAVAMDAARLLAGIDARRAAACRKAALEDYGDATLRFFRGDALPAMAANTPAPHQICAYGVQAALALFACTGDRRYAADATRYARRMLALQDRHPVGSQGITGYYTIDDDVDGRHSLEFHTSFADAPARALAQLCRTFPAHADWPHWYAAAAFESECFQRRGAQVAAPFHHLPNGVWSHADIEGCIQDSVAALPFGTFMGAVDIAPISDEHGVRADVAAEIAASFPLSDDHWLRTFPIPRDRVFHGATTLQLAAAAGVASAARLRKSPALDRLARQQLDWVMGTNPFAASLVAGTGFDHESHMLVWSDDLVGAMPVGMDNRRDQPFWPQTCHMTSRETWVVPTAKLALLVAELDAPATLHGVAHPEASFVCRRSGRAFPAVAGAYRLSVPAGSYDMRIGPRTLMSLNLLAGEDRPIDIDPDRFIAAVLSAGTEGAEPTIAALVRGRGPHRLALRGFNIVARNSRREIRLTGTEPVVDLSWRIRVVDPSAAWAAWLIVDDGPCPLADLVGPAGQTPMPVDAIRS